MNACVVQNPLGLLWVAGHVGQRHGRRGDNGTDAPMRHRGEGKEDRPLPPPCASFLRMLYALHIAMDVEMGLCGRLCGRSVFR
jgi:hypothetical protein